MKLRKPTMRRVYGWGINDAPYVVKDCPYYRRWVGMLQRAFCASYQKVHTCYIGTTVCEEWRSFMAFRAWMVQQEWAGRDLDKDSITDNKYYSPRTCSFIDPWINQGLAGRRRRGIPKPTRAPTELSPETEHDIDSLVHELL